MIQALRAHDEALGEQLDELRRSLGKRGGRLKLPGKIHFDLPTKVGADFADAFDVRLVEQTTASWEQWFGVLEKYVAENGTSRVPQSRIVDGYKLNRPGESGDSTSWEGWSHVRWFVEEVPAGVA